MHTEVSPDCGAATVIHDVRRLHDTRPRVSIIVVSHRRHAEICECLSDLAAQRTTVSFEVVRHQAKLEPPLKNIAAFSAAGRSLSGLGFLSTIAEITVYGRDQNGNEVSVTARLDVHFGDFADD